VVGDEVGLPLRGDKRRRREVSASFVAAAAGCFVKMFGWRVLSLRELENAIRSDGTRMLSCLTSLRLLNLCRNEI
jgi:hypothetical protein